MNDNKVTNMHEFAKQAILRETFECPSCDSQVDKIFNYCASCGEPVTENRVAFIRKMKTMFIWTGSLAALGAASIVSFGLYIIADRIDMIDGKLKQYEPLLFLIDADAYKKAMIKRDNNNLKYTQVGK